MNKSLSLQTEVRSIDQFAHANYTQKKIWYSFLTFLQVRQVTQFYLQCNLSDTVITRLHF